MLITTGNIWEYPSYWKVVPVNIGWKRNRCNVMGRGVAAQAAKIYPDLPALLGFYMQRAGADFTVLRSGFHNLFFFPVKPLVTEAPRLSWKQKASIDLVWKSTCELASLQLHHPVPILIPLVGCGNGQLRPEAVIPLLDSQLDDNCTLIAWKITDLPQTYHERVEPL